MPIDHYKMTIQAKPLESLGSKQDSGSDQVLLGISRPLGHLRKTRSLTNAVVDNPKPKTSDDQFPQIHNIGFYESEDEMSSKGSAISKDSSRTRKSQRRGSVSSVGISKSQVFENRYKLAAARSQPDTTKPANLYTKRVVYLPMFRINLETYVGDSEDHKAVETTRQSLKKILENSRSKMKSPDKIANKLRDYFKQQEMDAIKKQEREKENELSRKEMLRINLPKTPYPGDTNAIRIPSVPLDTKVQESDVKVETLDLTSITDDDVCSVLSSKTNKTKMSDNDNIHFHSERGTPNGLPKQYFGPFIYGKESETDRGPHNYATYSDIRKMRQKGRLKVVTKSNDSAKTTRSANSDQQDAKDWITIQSKPVLKYTTPQSVKAKLDPIVVPSQGCSECPMCKAAKYNKSTEPTNAPPNSPTPKQPPIEEIFPEIQAVHKVQVQRGGNNPEITEVSKVNMQTDDTLTPKTTNIIPTHENFSRKLGVNRGPAVQVKKATIHNETLPVSKVTVKLSKTKVGNIKVAKLTKSNSSSTQSINEL